MGAAFGGGFLVATATQSRISIMHRITGTLYRTRMIGIGPKRIHVNRGAA